jgi:cytochrome c oxidase subunit 2
MNTKYLVFALIVIVILGVGGFLVMNKKQTSTTTPAETTTTTPSAVMNATTSPSETGTGSAMQGETKVITISAKQFEFSPNMIKVKQGDKVTIKATSEDVEHGFALPDFGINLDLQPGQEVTKEFVADKKGTYTFFCSVPCGSGHREMKGTLVVE